MLGAGALVDSGAEIVSSAEVGLDGFAAMNHDA